MLQQELTMNIESSTDERDAKAERKARRPEASRSEPTKPSPSRSRGLCVAET